MSIYSEAFMVTSSISCACVRACGDFIKLETSIYIWLLRQSRVRACLVTSSILKFVSPTQSFEDTHRSRVCACALMITLSIMRCWRQIFFCCIFNSPAPLRLSTRDLSIQLSTLKVLRGSVCESWFQGWAWAHVYKRLGLLKNIIIFIWYHKYLYSFIYIVS